MSGANDHRAEKPWSVAIQRKVPSQNQFHYAHWTAYRKERDAWALLLRAQIPQRPAVSFPVQLLIASFRTRLCDYANLVGGAKPIPDCLIQLGWLRDDARRNGLRRHMNKPSFRQHKPARKLVGSRSI